jgi:hypothetical protein
MSPFSILLFLALHHRIAVTDTVHTRLSRIIQTTISDELSARSFVVVDDGADYIAEIVDASDRGGKGRSSQIARDTTHSVEVTEVVGGAAAEVRLYDSSHKQIASYRLTGSGSSSASVGAARGDVVTAFIFGSFLRRSRSADAAKGIAHDIAVSIASEITSPEQSMPPRDRATQHSN